MATHSYQFRKKNINPVQHIKYLDSSTMYVNVPIDDSDNN